MFALSERLIPPLDQCLDDQWHEWYAALPSFRFCSRPSHQLSAGACDPLVHPQLRVWPLEMCALPSEPKHFLTTQARAKQHQEEWFEAFPAHGGDEAFDVRRVRCRVLLRLLSRRLRQCGDIPHDVAPCGCLVQCCPQSLESVVSRPRSASRCFELALPPLDPFGREFPELDSPQEWLDMLVQADRVPV